MVHQVIKRKDVEVSTIGGHVKALEYVEGSKVENRKVIDRTTSQRMTLPKKLWKRDLKAVNLILLLDPKKPNDIMKSRILIEPIWGDEG